MIHLTRKSPLHTACIAGLACLVTASTLSYTLSAWGATASAEAAEIPGPTNEVQAIEPAGRAIQGDLDGDADGGSISGVEQPWGQITRIIPNFGMYALLFLPALPIEPEYDDDEPLHPDLQVLYLDRAYVDEPDVWERYGAYEWSGDTLRYAIPNGPAITPVYDENYENIAYCTVGYSMETTDYRDFYLRATVIVLEDGSFVETVFEPALIVYPEGSRPSEEETSPPAVIVKPEIPNGDIDGNRGNVVPGESERVDPESSPLDLLPSIGQAQAAPSGSGSDGSSTTADGAAEASASNGATSSSEGAGVKASTSTSDSSSQKAESSSETSTTSTGEHAPGFMLAIGATAVVVIVGAAAFACRGRIAKRFGKARL